MASYKPTPANGFVVARLRIEFGRHSWTEKHFYGAGDATSFINLLGWHCYLRSIWLGSLAKIVFASVSDLGSKRDGAAAPALPYSQPYPSLNQLQVADPQLGYEYRFDMPLANAGTVGQHWQYQLFRGIPANFVAQEQLQAPPWGEAYPWTDQVNTVLLQALPAMLGTVAPSNANPLNTVPGVAGITAAQTPTALGNLFVRFLQVYTYKMFFTPTLPITPPPAVQAGTWAAYAFGNVKYRRLASRRAGGIFGQPKGRYSS